MCPTTMPTTEKSVISEMISEMIEASRRGDKDEADRLKRELRKAGVNLIDPTKLKAKK